MNDSPRLARADGWVSARSPWTILAISTALLAVVALIDRATGWELSFSIFYLGPVSLTAWYAGRRVGTLMALLAATLWLVVDLLSGHPYASAFTPVWNALVRMGFFLITVLLLATVRGLLERERLLARTDPLTGLLNPRAFAAEADRLMTLARRYHHQTSLLYVDVDDFKGVNDRFGHEVGDRVLQGLAAALAAGVRKSDVIGRLGGDEFAILLPETDPAGALAAANDLRARLARSIEGGPGITLSVGAASFSSPPASLDDMIRAADGLMYDAKARGKDAVAYRAT